MPTKRTRRVAVLGARFGELDIERKLLGPLRVELAEGIGKEEAETLLLCRDAEVILCGGSPKIPATLIRRLPRLKVIVRYGIGVDTIDLAEATRRGVYVANVPDYCIEEVATHALALILSWARKLPIAQRSTQSGKWEVGVLKPLKSPCDLILGLVGFGRIAQSLARKARGIGFQVWANDPYVKKNMMEKKRVRPAPLDHLIRSSDFISLHLPLTSQSHHLIDARALRRMKPTAYLINTSRGGLIDEKALFQALKEGWIAGAALDVLEEEPWKADSPLRSLENLIVTPHTAWYTERAQTGLRRKACAEVIRILRGKVPKNLVNREVLKDNQHSRH
jgi:D-3-phosphoglycerate dehydrogenase